MTTKLQAAFGGVAALAVAAFAFTASAQEAAPVEATPAPAEAPAEAAPAAEPAAPVAPEAAAKPTVQYLPGELGKPAAGKGQVVFFRPSKLMGAALSFKVREEGVELGKLSNGAYFVQDVEPGLHEYVVHSEVKDVTPIEVEEGEVYYLAFSLSIGVMAGRPNLTPTDEAAFQKASGSMKPSKWAPEAK